jgi:molecular chaperone GrpE (heat shock protein)
MVHAPAPQVSELRVSLASAQLEAAALRDNKPSPKLAEQAAQLAQLKEEAVERIEDERDLSMLRIKLSLTHQGVPATKIEKVLTDELAFSDSLLAALERTTVQLDSACAFIINR